MQHFQAALALIHWLAADQGIDPLGSTAGQIASFLFSLSKTQCLSLQTVTGYRSCLASVLRHTGKAAVEHDRIISDMITLTELEVPRFTPVMPE